MERVNELHHDSYQQTSTLLWEELQHVKLEELPGFLTLRRAELITSPHPFADYMREKIREKGLLQQNIFLAADLPERYGYRLISEEKHTRRRDTILRLCLAASLSAEEVQEALILYGMAPLHARFPRDAALLAAIHNRLYDVHEVDALLRKNGFQPLLA